MVSRNLPLYEQVTQQLLEWVRDARNSGNDSLPSEPEIAKMLQVSRATVREALSNLERDRVIVRRHGSGTFINPAIRNMHATVDVFLEPDALIEKQGYTASVGFRELRLSTIEDAALAKSLEKMPGTPTLQFSILYLADSQPVIFVEGIVPIEQPDFNFDTIKNAPDLSTIIEHCILDTAMYTITSLRAINASSNQAKMLNLEQGAALVCLEEFHASQANRQIYFTQSLYVPGRIALQLFRNRVASPGRVSIW